MSSFLFAKMEKHETKIAYREPSIDLIESIAILFVLLYHSTLYSCNILSGTALDYARYFLRGFLACCVPLFFFANGYLLLNKPFDLKKHVRRIVRLVILTAVWGIITVLCYMPIKGASLSFSEIIMKVWHFEENWTNHLWFIGALTCVYILFPLLKLAWDNNKNIFMFFSIVAFCMTIGNEMINEILTLFSALILHTDTAYEGLNFFNIFNPFRYIRGYAFAYFCLGGYAYLLKNAVLRIPAWKRNVFSSITLLISGICLGSVAAIYSRLYDAQQDIVWNHMDSFFTFVNIICIFVLCLNHKKDTALFRTISSNTLGIYFMHGIIINATLPYVLSVPAFHNFGINVLYAVLVILICLGIIWIFKKIPVLRELVKLK